MCTKIHDLFGVTIWACPKSLECVTTDQHYFNRTMNITLGHPLENRTINITLGHPLENRTMNITLGHPLENRTMNITLSNTTLNPGARPPTPSPMHDSPTPSPMHDSPTPSPMLRSPPSPSNYFPSPSNYSHTIAEDTAWAHIFWILPVIFIIMCTIKYRAVMPLPSRIRSFFEPAERYVTRSQSWPQMNSRDENRTNSEPAFTTVVF